MPSSPRSMYISLSISLCSIQLLSELRVRFAFRTWIASSPSSVLFCALTLNSTSLSRIHAVSSSSSTLDRLFHIPPHIHVGKSIYIHMHEQRSMCKLFGKLAIDLSSRSLAVRELKLCGARAVSRARLLIMARRGRSLSVCRLARVVVALTLAHCICSPPSAVDSIQRGCSCDRSPPHTAAAAASPGLTSRAHADRSHRHQRTTRVRSHTQTESSPTPADIMSTPVRQPTDTCVRWRG
jgi:hypothetical protein